MNRPTTNHGTNEESTEFPAVDPLDEASGPSRRLVIGVFTAIGLVAIAWIYVIFFYRPELMIDELADRTFPRNAEEICAEAQARFRELPAASLAESHLDRAQEVEQSNEIFSAMVTDLRRIVPSDPPEAKEAVNEWLDDWDTYMGDRRDYVTNLRQDPQARFLETAKGGPSKGITRAIAAFAQVNRMDSCAPPADLS